MFKQVELQSVPDFRPAVLLHKTPSLLAFINTPAPIPAVLDLAKLHKAPITFIVKDREAATKIYNKTKCRTYFLNEPISGPDEKQFLLIRENMMQLLSIETAPEPELASDSADLVKDLVYEMVWKAVALGSQQSEEERMCTEILTELIQKVVKRRSRLEQLQAINSEREFYKNKFDEQKMMIERLQAELRQSEAGTHRGFSRDTEEMQDIDYWNTQDEPQQRHEKTRLNDILGSNQLYITQVADSPGLMSGLSTPQPTSSKRDGPTPHAGSGAMNLQAQRQQFNAAKKSATGGAKGLGKSVSQRELTQKTARDSWQNATMSGSKRGTPGAGHMSNFGKMAMNTQGPQRTQRKPTDPKKRAAAL